MRCTPVRCTPTGLTSIRCTFSEVHAHEVHAHEVHTREVHAYMVHNLYTAMRYTPARNAAKQGEHQEYIDVLSPHRQSLQNKQCFHNQYMQTCLLCATSTICCVQQTGGW
jgi:hypothetical protein